MSALNVTSHYVHVYYTCPTSSSMHHWIVWPTMMAFYQVYIPLIYCICTLYLPPSLLPSLPLCPVWLYCTLQGQGPSFIPVHWNGFWPWEEAVKCHGSDNGACSRTGSSDTRKHQQIQETSHQPGSEVHNLRSILNVCTCTCIYVALSP